LKSKISIIVGARHDSTTMLNPLVFENFILKLDADGNVLSTGIFENGKLTTLQAKVYPNPTHSSIRFNVPFETFFDLEIFAIDGRVVFQQKNFNSGQSIQTHEYVNGIYSYRITTQKQVYQGKFIKD